MLNQKSYSNSTPTETKQKKKGKASCKHLILEEEARLAHVWVEVSEDPKFRKNQNAPTFNRQITSRFLYKLNIGDCRKKNQVYSKWRNTNKVFMEFYTIFSSVTWQWQSGVNDETILQKALPLY